MKTKNLKQSFGRRCTLSLSIAIVLFVAGLCNLGTLRQAYGEWWEPTDSMVAGQTLIRAQHFLELRNAIDNKRALRGLAPITWTDPSLIRGQTSIRAIHMKEIRDALQEIYNEPPSRAVSFTFTDTVANASDLEGVNIKLSHILEIRQAWEEVTFCGDGICNGPEDAGNCKDDCLCNYGPWEEAGDCGVGTCDAFEKQQIKIDIDGTEGCEDLFQCIVMYSTCCHYTPWTNVGCETPACPDNSDMEQNQTAEVGCPDRTQCFEDHPSCCSYDEEPSYLGCGKGDCERNEVLWGRAASAPECPIHPLAVCLLDTDEGMDCCGYPGWVSQPEWCGMDGYGKDCEEDEIYFENVPPDPDDVFCPGEAKCEVSAECCDYSDPVPGECGGTCPGPDWVLDTKTPAHPSALCLPTENCRHDEAYCCGGYGPYMDQGCAPDGSGCNPDQRYEISYPLDDEAGCNDHTRCVPDEITCCGGYKIFTSLVCGTDGCGPDSRYQVETPIDFPTTCPDRSPTCVLDEEGCCNGYTLSVGDCGVSCGPDKRHHVRAPGTYATGCLDKDVGCVSDLVGCCGYAASVSDTCWTGSCGPTERAKINAPTVDGSTCPDIDLGCVIDEDFCCGGYRLEADMGCGDGDPCASNYKEWVSEPYNDPTGCPNKTNCVLNQADCCTYGESQPNMVDGCGLGNCDPGYRQWVAPGSTDCADILTCHLDEICNDCSPTTTAPCDVGGCKGTKTCEASGFYGACIQNPPECPFIGAEQTCFNDQSVESYQFCDACFEWGDCRCTYGDVRPCTTEGGCPGQRTCANNIWEKCQRIKICNPGTTIACTTDGGFPGALICNACGDAYSTDCLCVDGTQVPCEGGLRTCTDGVWGSCITP